LVIPQGHDSHYGPVVAIDSAQLVGGSRLLAVFYREYKFPRGVTLQFSFVSILINSFELHENYIPPLLRLEATFDAAAGCGSPPLAL
jgi:hypothetical protein